VAWAILGAVFIILKMAHVHQWMGSVEVWVIASSASILFVMGLADDLWRWDRRIRVLSQALAAGLMVYGGGIALADLHEMTADGEYAVQVYQPHPDGGELRLYAVLETPLAEDSRFADELGQQVRRLRQCFNAMEGVEVRQYVRRDPGHERRVGQRNVGQDRRQVGRCGVGDPVLYAADDGFNDRLPGDLRFVEDPERRSSSQSVAAEMD
jgi:hypothetical protein